MSIISQSHEKIDYVDKVFPKPVLQAREKLKVTRKCFKGISAARDLIELLRPVPALISKMCTTVKMFAIFEAPFSLVSLFSNVVTFGHSGGVGEKAKALHGTLKEGCAVAKSAARACKLLSLLKVVGKSALAWFPVLDVICFGVSIITFGFSCPALYINHRIRVTLNMADLSAHPDETVDTKAQVLRTALTSLKNIGEENLKKQLLISKPSLKKIDSLYKKLVDKPEQREKYVAKGMAYIEKLRDRFSTNLCFTVASMAAKLAGIVATGLLFFLPLTPVGIIGLSVLTFVNLAIWARKAYVVDKNLLVKQKAAVVTSETGTRTQAAQTKELCNNKLPELAGCEP